MSEFVSKQKKNNCSICMTNDGLIHDGHFEKKYFISQVVNVACYLWVSLKVAVVSRMVQKLRMTSLTRPEIEATSYHTPAEQANHYTTDAISKVCKVQIAQNG